MSDRKALDVYVRLGSGGGDEGDDTVREISFQIPEGVSQAVLLDHDYAIDGNSAVKSVEAHKNGFEQYSLAESLADEEKTLVEWLGEKGFDVVFK